MSEEEVGCLVLLVLATFSKIYKGAVAGVWLLTASMPPAPDSHLSDPQVAAFLRISNRLIFSLYIS